MHQVPLPVGNQTSNPGESQRNMVWQVAKHSMLSMPRPRMAPSAPQLRINSHANIPPPQPRHTAVEMHCHVPSNGAVFCHGLLQCLSSCPTTIYLAPPPPSQPHTRMSCFTRLMESMHTYQSLLFLCHPPLPPLRRLCPTPHSPNTPLIRATTSSVTPMTAAHTSSNATCHQGMYTSMVWRKGVGATSAAYSTQPTAESMGLGLGGNGGRNV